MSKKTPHWIRKTHLFRADEFVCSVCGAVCPKPYKICPSCGVNPGKTVYSPDWVDEAEMISAIMDDDW